MEHRYEESCIACRTNRGEIKPPGGLILSGKYWRLEHTLMPTVTGWLILKTLSHREDLLGFPRSGMLELADFLWLAEIALYEAVRPERVYVARFCQIVNHVHFHIFPKRADMRIPGGARGSRIFEVAANEVAWHGTSGQIESACAAIRASFAGRIE